MDVTVGVIDLVAADRVAEIVFVPETDGDPLTDGLPDALPEDENETETDELDDALPVTDTLAVLLTEPVELTVIDGETVVDTVAEADGVAGLHSPAGRAKSIGPSNP